MKSSCKAGAGIVVLIALFSPIARGDATIISQTRSIDYYYQITNSMTGQPTGPFQLAAIQSAPDFGPFNASLKNSFNTWATQTSSITGLTVQAVGDTDYGETSSFPYTIYYGDSNVSVTFQLDSPMTYSCTNKEFFIGDPSKYGSKLLGPSNQTISFSRNSGTTTGVIGPGQWTFQILDGEFGDYNVSLALTPEPATLGLVLAPLLICRRQCRC